MVTTSHRHEFDPAKELRKNISSKIAQKHHHNNFKIRIRTSHPLMHITANSCENAERNFHFWSRKIFSFFGALNYLVQPETRSQDTENIPPLFKISWTENESLCRHLLHCSNPVLLIQLIWTPW